MSDIADDGDCCGGIVPRGGGDMGPNTGSEVVLGVTFHGVVDFAEKRDTLHFLCGTGSKRNLNRSVTIYYMRNFSNLIGLEHWYFSLI